jgi:hypothetical protein
MAPYITPSGLQGIGAPATVVPNIPWAVAQGTSDAITAAYTPPNTALTDGLVLAFRAIANNTTTTPTFAPDGLAAKTITKQSGALGGNDIQQYGEYYIRYNAAQGYWKLLASPPGGANVSSPVLVTQGGTNATTAATARTNLGAAASGANSDITSLSALSTPLSLAQGGVGATTGSGARTNIGAAAAGANSDITSLSALTSLTVGAGATSMGGTLAVSGVSTFGSNLNIPSLYLTANPPLSQFVAGQNANGGVVANCTANQSGAAEVSGIFRMTSSVGGSASGINTNAAYYKAPLQTEMIANNGCAPAWGFVTAMTLGSGFPVFNQNAIGYEIDINNTSGTDFNVDTDPGLGTIPVSAGLYITAGSVGNQIQSAIQIAGSNHYRNAMLLTSGSVVSNGWLDYSSAINILLDKGSHTNGIALGGTYTSYALYVGSGPNFSVTGAGAVVAASLTIGTTVLNSSSLTTGSLALTTPLPQSSGGTGDNSAAFTTFSPTLTPGSGSFTTASATGRYQKLGRKVFVEINIVITTNNTAAGNITVGALPFTSAASGGWALVAKEVVATGAIGAMHIGTGATTGILQSATGGYLGGSGQTIYISGWYESNT